MKHLVSILLAFLFCLSLVPADDMIASGAPDDDVAIDAETFPDPVFRSYVSSNFDVDGNGVLSAEEIDAVRCIYLDPESVPDYVSAETSAMASRVRSHLKNDSIVFFAASDSHQSTTAHVEDGNLHAGMAMMTLRNVLPIDFAAFLGDYTAGGATTTIEEGLEQIAEINADIDDAFRGLPQFRTVGNHDALGCSFSQNGRTLTQEQLYALIGKYNADSGATMGSTTAGYCYRDFADKKLRVICLNTADVTSPIESAEGISGAQKRWFADTLISTPEGYGIVLLAHHPLDWGDIMAASHILRAYVEEHADMTIDGISYCFTGRNKSAWVLQFHGHVHTFTVDDLHWNNGGTGTSYGVKRIATPNMCFVRNNEYGQNGGTEYYGIEFGTAETYNKTADSGKDTAFCVYVVNPSEQKVYAVCYGAGPDREVFWGAERTSATVDAVGFPAEDAENTATILPESEGMTISQSEIIENHSVGSLKGIEHFPKLTKLTCSDHCLTALDVSKNTALEYLYCQNNDLTSLDVSKNGRLKVLACYGNRIGALYINPCPNLVDAYSNGTPVDHDNGKYRSYERVDDGFCLSVDFATVIHIEHITPPSVAVQPESRTAGAGSPVKFTVEADGDNLAYQWYYRTSSSDVWKRSTVTGADSATLELDAWAYRNGYQYRCLIENVAGKICSDAATLTVKTVITAQPKGVNGAVGDTVKIAVKATGAGLTYRWQYRAAGSDSWLRSSFEGADTAVLKVPVTAWRNGYQYRCVITDTNGKKTYSSSAKLTVKTAITVQPGDVSGSLGDMVRITVKATGAGLTYQWQYKAAGSTSWLRSGFEGSDTTVLKVPVTAWRNGYQYRCVITDANGKKTYSAAAMLTVM